MAFPVGYVIAMSLVIAAVLWLRKRRNNTL